MKKTIVIYKVKAGRVEENEDLVKSVYRELKETETEKFSYATFLLSDGHTFVHVALQEKEGKSPLGDLPAFRAFQKNINERCEEEPKVSHVIEIGSYNFGNSQKILTRF